MKTDNATNSNSEHPATLKRLHRGHAIADAIRERQQVAAHDSADPAAALLHMEIGDALQDALRLLNHCDHSASRLLDAVIALLIQTQTSAKDAVMFETQTVERNFTAEFPLVMDHLLAARRGLSGLSITAAHNDNGTQVLFSIACQCVKCRKARADVYATIESRTALIDFIDGLQVLDDAPVDSMQLLCYAAGVRDVRIIQRYSATSDRYLWRYDGGSAWYTINKEDLLRMFADAKVKIREAGQ